MLCPWQCTQLGFGKFWIYPVKTVLVVFLGWTVCFCLSMKRYTSVVGFFSFSTFHREVDTSREKGRDMTQSYDKSPYADRWSKKQTKLPPKTLITQQLQADLGRSVWVTIARTVSNNSHQTGVVKLVYRIPTFPLTVKAV